MAEMGLGYCAAGMGREYVDGKQLKQLEKNNFVKLLETNGFPASASAKGTITFQATMCATPASPPPRARTLTHTHTHITSHHITIEHTHTHTHNVPGIAS